MSDCWILPPYMGRPSLNYEGDRKFKQNLLIQSVATCRYERMSLAHGVNPHRWRERQAMLADLKPHAARAPSRNSFGSRSPLFARVMIRAAIIFSTILLGRPNA